MNYWSQVVSPPCAFCALTRMRNKDPLLVTTSSQGFVKNKNPPLSGADLIKLAQLDSNQHTQNQNL